MVPHATRLLGGLAAALALSCAAAVPTAAFADGPRGYHGPRWSGPAPVYRVGPGYYRGGGHYRGGGRYHGGGWVWGGLALGLGVGALIAARPWEPVVVQPPPTYVYVDPPPAPPPPLTMAQPVPSKPAEPIVYPSRGQSAEQTEADRQECNRWATTQPSAMADASVFHRATLACLEGRGYTVR